MGLINDNIANNIVKLRKANNMTQIELAFLLNYSDKAISKWERAESVPDIEMLYRIADLFKVNVDFLTKEHTDAEIANLKGNGKIFVRNLLITIMLCVAMFLISTVVFVYGTVKQPELSSKYWVSFVAATPICSLIVYIYAHRERYWLAKLISISAFVWTLITTAFCFTLIAGSTKFWLLFVVGAPIQIAICLFFFWKKTF